LIFNISKAFQIKCCKFEKLSNALENLVRGVLWPLLYRSIDFLKPLAASMLIRAVEIPLGQFS
jgi:hypothetical protein